MDKPPDRPAAVWFHIVYLVARREFLTRVRTRFFTIGTAVLLVAVAGWIVLQGTVLGQMQTTYQVACLGAAQALRQPLLC